MVTTEPSCKPQINRAPVAEGSFSQRPAVRAVVRGLSFVAGLAVSVVAFVVVGLVAVLSDCLGGETSGLCASAPGLVAVLEWPILAIAVLAPLAGGVVACESRRPRWLALGVGVAVVMFALMLAITTGQSGTLS